MNILAALELGQLLRVYLELLRHRMLLLSPRQALVAPVVDRLQM